MGRALRRGRGADRKKLEVYEERGQGMSGIDKGDYDMGCDPVSDKINDMVEDYTNGNDVQEFIEFTLDELDAVISQLETAARIATGYDSWTYPVDGDLRALRCAIETYMDKPVKRQANEPR